MKFIYFLLFLLSVSCTYAQSSHYLKISGGKMFFGTGDIPGYAIYTEYSSALTKQKQNYWKHFQLGGELGFETGAIQPASINPAPADFLELFYQVSNASLYGKLAYYPIGTTFMKGLNVAIGPTAGYSLFSKSGGSEISVLPNGTTIKSFYMVYDNYIFIGYRISAGYEYYFKKWLVGARLDWSNTQKGDINTMYGAKIGWKL